MEKYKLEKVRTTQQILENLVTRVNKLTSGNVSHNVASIRSVTTNLNTVMIHSLIKACEKEDSELKQLLEKIEKNIRAVDNLLKQLTPMTVGNGKKHIASWINFYADALDKALAKYGV